MTVTITITGEDAQAAMNQLRGILFAISPSNAAMEFAVAQATTTAKTLVEEAKAEPEKEKKTRKAKEEKVAEPKAEVLAPEKPKYTLQDAIDRAREIAGDGKDEKIINALKGINTRLGISKVREIPPEKLDGYMVELEKEFPKEAAATSANMFD